MREEREECNYDMENFLMLSTRHLYECLRRASKSYDKTRERKIKQILQCEQSIKASRGIKISLIVKKSTPSQGSREKRQHDHCTTD